MALIPNMKSELDPTGKSPHQLGAKLDAGKPAVWRGLLDYFPRACIAVADVSTRGAQKYAWKGWEQVPDGEARYADALSRHIVKEAIEGLHDVGQGGLGPDVLHASQIAWNALARLELILRRLDAKPAVSESRTNDVAAGYVSAGLEVGRGILGNSRG